MDTKYFLILAFLMPILFMVSGVRRKLRRTGPTQRFWIGFASLVGSILVFLSTLKFLPHPAEEGLVHKIVLTALSSAVAGGVILSVVLIASAGMEWFKRWNSHQRRGS
ncbi:hypothetical protein [Sphingopyxis sp. RIFCSPHIGHO2_12_FULL_65_19]|uniref:hypothetical protein n=1 Tax=Sphingopyxis sp. RIFCSPHIGHO2_12_FULL_65_19 TaxID=1802172 RepID=UPI0008CC2FA4|nr:hypothetical protein [Sphingopyxis sp. RIFCSPHIGHO2_12_FULL_65_19]OHD08746.1 MAG: hypothetical protein A3E77_02480 [Sphingopyxis sp. RIFCSPHIGHO2_12_FULL_65_19]